MTSPQPAAGRRRRPDGAAPTGGLWRRAGDPPGRQWSPSWPTVVATGTLGAAAVAQYGPAVAGWRHMRSALLPRLAGVGRDGHVALTFDDGPDPRSTPQFLEALERHGWRATFFLLGEMVQRAPSLAAEIAAAGHEIAVHGHTHTNYLHAHPARSGEDLRRGIDTVASATGVAPRWFRPPYGALSGTALLLARRHRLTTVLWTTWGRDWRPDATPASVSASVARTFRPGATILLHDSDCTSAPGSWRSALGAVDPLADWLTARRQIVGPLAEHGIAGDDNGAGAGAAPPGATLRAVARP